MIDIEEETQRLIAQVQDIERVMKENLEALQYSHEAALQLRSEHTKLQATLRAYINGDITKEEALSVLDSMNWE